MTGVRRHVLRLSAASLLLAAGLAAALYAPGRGSGATTTGSTPTTAGATTTTAQTTTSAASTVLAVSGHGWGHGLGLSQWGAYGYARHGWTYTRILAHYYPGTTLGASTTSLVRVLVADGKKATLTSTVPWTVIDANGVRVSLPPGDLALTATQLAVADHPDLQPPFRFAAKQPLAVNGTAYRGTFRVETAGKHLEVIDVVALESYLQGVVPSEMPSQWSPEALKAQAVAARSYALANLAHGRDFDLYGDTRSQAYGGVAAESAPATAAVTATRGQVLLYAGQVADTLYFSSSGGRTVSAAEATGLAVPYLVSVPDPYDTASPYHDWGPVLFDGAKVQTLLKLSAPPADVQVTPGASGRAKAVTVVSADDSQVTLTGSQLRTALGLRSTWFSPALLQLLPASTTMTYGGATSLSGLARGVDTLSLESRTAGGTWTPVGDLVVGPDGTYSTVVKPQATTQYRLAWGDVRAGLAKVAVAPRLAATALPDGVQGTMRPVVAGAAVELQQQDGAGWTTLASTVADSTGAWSFTQTLSPGTYRVRCAPGHGLAVGLSAPLTVQ